MKTTLKYILMTATFMTCVAGVSSLAKADPTVMCSVRANYQGGVDVHGKPVAPADVQSPAAVPMPRSVRIPLTVDLAQRMNEVLPAGMKLEPEIGTVEILNDGRVIINGKDMTGPASALCATVAKQKEAAMKTKDAPKKKKIKKRVADVPADVNEPPVVAQPAEPVAPAEPMVAEPIVPAVSEPAQDAAPQVLSAPVEPSMPQAEPIMQEPVAVPEDAVQPPSDGALSPSGEEGMLPRPPSEDTSAMPPASDTLPVPPQGDDGMLSGGAQ